jgi:uncharacterized protein YndB with AHSA1/START domain
VRLEWTAVVDRPIEDIFAFLTDPFNRPRQRGGALSARLTSPGPIGLRSTFDQRSELLGIEYRLTGEFTAFDPPRLLEVSMGGGPIRSVVARDTLEPVANGTKLTIVVEHVEWRPWFRPLSPLLMPIVRRRFEASNRNLVRLLEADAPAPDTARDSG